MASCLRYLVEKVDILLKTEEILEGYNIDVSVICYNAMKQVEQIKEGIQVLETRLKAQKEQLSKCKEFLNTLQQAEKFILHIENNIPERLLENVNNKAKHMKISEEKSQKSHFTPRSGPWNDLSPCYSALSARKHLKSTSAPSIMYLTPYEFDNLPKYMKGRLTCDAINTFIAAFNTALEKKYQIFSLPRNSFKGKTLVKYDKFKNQETKETIEKGIYFCTEEDLKTMGNIKMDKASQNMLNILRNAHRMREIRNPGIVRYAVFH